MWRWSWLCHYYLYGNFLVYFGCLSLLSIDISYVRSVPHFIEFVSYLYFTYLLDSWYCETKAFQLCTLLVLLHVTVEIVMVECSLSIIICTPQLTIPPLPLLLTLKLRNVCWCHPSPWQPTRIRATTNNWYIYIFIPYYPCNIPLIYKKSYVCVIRKRHVKITTIEK